jgi:hypothetical protein
MTLFETFRGQGAVVDLSCLSILYKVFVFHGYMTFVVNF